MISDEALELVILNKKKKIAKIKAEIDDLLDRADPFAMLNLNFKKENKEIEKLQTQLDILEIIKG